METESLRAVYIAPESEELNIVLNDPVLQESGTSGAGGGNQGGGGDICTDDDD